MSNGRGESTRRFNGLGQYRWCARKREDHQEQQQAAPSIQLGDEAACSSSLCGVERHQRRLHPCTANFIYTALLQESTSLHLKCGVRPNSQSPGRRTERRTLRGPPRHLEFGGECGIERQSEGGRGVEPKRLGPWPPSCVSRIARTVSNSIGVRTTASSSLPGSGSSQASQSKRISGT